MPHSHMFNVKGEVGSGHNWDEYNIAITQMEDALSCPSIHYMSTYSTRPTMSSPDQSPSPMCPHHRALPLLSQGHTHRHSHLRPRSRLIRSTQSRHSSLHVLLPAFFQYGNFRLRGLIRPSIPKTRGSCAGIARPLEATSELSFVRNLAETCGLGRC